MTGEKDGMVSMFGPDTWCGKTSPEHSAPTAAKTSKPSSRKSPGSQSRTSLMCLCLRRGGGLKPDASTERWETGLLPIGSTMLNIGEFRSEENGLLSLPTSTDSRLPQFSLTLNCGEKPRIPNPTKLSEILEPSVDPKYNLSAKACQGILNRAAKRGKELPKALLDALKEQARSDSTNREEKAEETSQQEFPQPLQEIATEPHTPFLSKNEPDAMGGARESLSRMSESEPYQPLTTNPSSPKPYGFSSFDSNAMKSPNPHSGIYEADTSRTLDLNGGSPACNQGGWRLSQPLTAGTEPKTPFVNGTLQAKEQGQNLNSNNVVRVPNPNSFKTPGRLNQSKPCPVQTPMTRNPNGSTTETERGTA